MGQSRTVLLGHGLPLRTTRGLKRFMPTSTQAVVNRCCRSDFWRDCECSADNTTAIVVYFLHPESTAGATDISDGAAAVPTPPQLSEQKCLLQNPTKVPRHLEREGSEREPQIEKDEGENGPHGLDDPGKSRLKLARVSPGTAVKSPPRRRHRGGKKNVTFAD